MATVEERKKILVMVQEGKISAEQGAQLLEVLETAGPRLNAGLPSVPGVPPVPGRWFHVQITDTNTGRTRVNVRMPASLVSAGAKMGARLAPQVEGLDSKKLLTYLESGETGKIVDVYNEENGEHVEVFIE